MLIGSKLPPDRIDRTFFSSGRAAFSYLVGEVIRPRKVYLPAFTCWSLVSAMERRYPKIELEFYPVDRDLSCHFPAAVCEDEMLVFIHFFGHEYPLPTGLSSRGTLLEDWSHAYLSQIKPTGDYVFGSYRKIMKVADGGFINHFFNPVYEPSRKLDTWLRYESRDWRDVREAENMTDRDWQIADISSQSLAVLLNASPDLIRIKRCKNESFLHSEIKIGTPLVNFSKNECPLLHNRIFASADDRDSLRAFLATRGVFTSIHWPTHPAIKKARCDVEDVLWLESHILSFPVSHDYGLNDMEYMVSCMDEWARAGS